MDLGIGGRKIVNQGKCLIKLFFRLFVNRFHSQKFSVARAAGIVFFSAFFLPFVYFLSGETFHFLWKVPVAGPILLEKFFSLIFLTLFGLVFYSSMLSALSVVFLSRDLECLLSLPVPVWKSAALKVWQGMWGAVWMPALLFFPVFTAYAVLYRVNALVSAAAFFVVLVFLFLCAVGGVYAMLFLLRWVPPRRLRDALLALGVLALAVGFSLFRFSAVGEMVRDPREIENWMGYVESWRKPGAPWLASTWAAVAVQGLFQGKQEVFWKNFSLLFGSAFFLFAGLPWCLKRFFLRAWCHARESIGGRFQPHGMGRVPFRVLKNEERKVSGNFLRPYAALFRKDARLFLRDSTQWGQFLLLAALAGVYVYYLHKLPLADYPQLQGVFLFLSLGFTGLILAAVSARWAFPPVSLEGKAFWIVLTAPLSRKGYLKYRVFWASLGLFVLLLGIAFSTAPIWKESAFWSVWTMAHWLVWVPFLSVLGAGLGAALPVFEAESAAKIPSSLGGYLFMLVCVSLIFLTLLMEITPLRLLRSEGPAFFWKHPWEIMIPLHHILFLTFSAAAAAFFAGLNRLKQGE